MSNQNEEFKKRVISLLKTYENIVRAKRDANVGTSISLYLEGQIAVLEFVLEEIEKMEP